MKKLVLLLCVLLIGFTFVNAEEPCDIKSFSLTVGAGMRNVSEDLFKDVYGGSSISYNVDLAYRIFDSLEVFAHTDYFSVDGELTFTREETTLKIIPIELGARYLIKLNSSCKPKIFPYIGAGAGYYSIKEENTIGTFDEKKVGFFAEGGVRVYLGSSFFIDAKVKNVFLKVENTLGNQMDVGGFSYMGGIGISI